MLRCEWLATASQAVFQLYVLSKSVIALCNRNNRSTSKSESASSIEDSKVYQKPQLPYFERRVGMRGPLHNWVCVGLTSSLFVFYGMNFGNYITLQVNLEPANVTTIGCFGVSSSRADHVPFISVACQGSPWFGQQYLQRWTRLDLRKGILYLS